jgi:hypothetical protein
MDILCRRASRHTSAPSFVGLCSVAGTHARAAARRRRRCKVARLPQVQAVPARLRLPSTLALVGAACDELPRVLAALGGGGVGGGGGGDVGGGAGQEGEDEGEVEEEFFDECEQYDRIVWRLVGEDADPETYIMKRVMSRHVRASASIRTDRVEARRSVLGVDAMLGSGVPGFGNTRPASAQVDTLLARLCDAAASVEGGGAGGECPAARSTHHHGGPRNTRQDKTTG